ncbi:MAG: ATPase [bacterium]|nr:MAG: ATPase [bacterium]
MYISRKIEEKLLQLIKQFPVVSVTGPRQSGKSTLVKTLFPDYEYISLENPGVRLRAVKDPLSFLKNRSQRVIIDEIQYIPELLSYIQLIVDERNIPGNFIITGSQNLLISENISQSLAGRVGILRLLPFSLEELDTKGTDYTDYIFKGFYPRLYSFNIQPEDFYSSYVETYVERDVRRIINVKNLHLFMNFIRLCAGRTGQVLDYRSLSNSSGVSVSTAKAWISILEASYVVFLLRPYYNNFKKRVIKRPKLYFYDTGLAAYLLEIENSKQLETHYARGSLFENMIVAELLKKRYNSGKNSNLFFYRDSNQHEIDIIMDFANSKNLIELKSAKTFTKDFIKEFKYWKKNIEKENTHFFVVYGGEEDFDFLDSKIVSWRNLHRNF